MRAKRSWVVVWLLLSPGAARAEDVAGASASFAQEGAPVAEAPPAVESEGTVATRQWHHLMRLEATTWALLPRAGMGTEEGFAQVEPTVILDGGPEFGVNVGAPVRLRLWGGGEGAGFVRREDWDTLSDWGQLVRGLKLGSDHAPLGVWLGALEDYSLLSGHLVRRYSNRTNPDYHPAGGFLTGTVGPLYVESFASDVLGARLLGVEAALDVQHVLFGKPREKGRYTLALSAVHDWGRAGGKAPSTTLAHLDVTAVVLVRPGFEAHVLAGWGGRPGDGGAWGAVVGAGADAAQLAERSLEVALKGLVVGMGQPGARYLGVAEMRWRILGGRVYALGTGGTLLLPEADGTLRPGAYASVGLGVDNAR